MTYRVRDSTNPIPRTLITDDQVIDYLEKLDNRTFEIKLLHHVHWVTFELINSHDSWILSSTEYGDYCSESITEVFQCVSRCLIGE